MKLATAAEAALETATATTTSTSTATATANGDKLSEVWYQKSINKAPAANASSAAQLLTAFKKHFFISFRRQNFSLCSPSLCVCS